MTRVITYSWAPAGLAIPATKPGWGTSVSWSAWTANQRKWIVEGILEWMKYMDVVLVEIPDNGNPLAANSHSDWHVRLVCSTYDGAGGSVANAGSFAGALGEDSYVLHDSADADHPLETYDYQNACQWIGMHEAGHWLAGVPHKNGSTVMNPSLNVSLSVDSAQRSTAEGRHGADKTMSQLYDGPVGQITSLYRGLLTRLPDGGGFKFYHEQVSGGAIGLTDFAATLMASGEYLGGGQSVSQYVSSLYINMFGRVAGSSEKQFYIDAINNGDKTRPQVAAEFADSTESRNVLLSAYPNGWWRP